MNLASYMAMSVTPLAEYLPTRKEFPDEAKPKKLAPSVENVIKHNANRHLFTRAKYAEVMGSDWIHITAIEAALGMGRGNGRATLKKWLKQGTAERRKYSPDGRGWTRNMGYQWRLI